jgi:tetratricopeptide (TPR) repeat protein
LDPNNFKVWYSKGLALDNLGRHKEAIPYYDKALEIDPNYADALNNKGVALEKLGKYEDATKCFDKAQQLREKNQNREDSLR